MRIGATTRQYFPPRIFRYSTLLSPRCLSTRAHATATMASPYHVQIKPDYTGLWESKQDENAASKATSLLQADLEVGLSLLAVKWHC